MPMGHGMRGRGRGFGLGRGRRGRGCCHGRCHSLCNLHTGGIAVIDSISCQGGYKRKLLSMGVIPGREVTCIRDNGSSGLCIRVGTSEFIVNSNIAEEIHVRSDQESEIV